MPRRWLSTTVLAITTLVASGCQTRDDRAYRAWEGRHPALAVAADCAEIATYVVLDVSLRAAALALSR